MRAVKSFFLDDIVLKLAGAAGGFNCIHVESRANAARSHRNAESLLIDNLATRGVDEGSTSSNRIKNSRAQQMVGFRIQCQVNTDDIRDARHSFRRLF